MPQETTEESESAVRVTPARESFEMWALSLGLNRKTTGILRHNDISSKEILVLLSDEILAEMELSVGQTLLLQKAIQDLKDKRSSSRGAGALLTSQDLAQTNIKSAESAEQDHGLSGAGKLFDELFLPTTDGPRSKSPYIIDTIKENDQAKYTFPPGQDPRLLLTTKATNKKAIHIADHLSEKAKIRRLARKKKMAKSTYTTIDDQGRLVVIDDDEKTYSDIRFSEWNTANCRVMAQLLKKGDLDVADIDFYLSYTIYISELVDRFTWESILAYDHSYRERQAEHSFPWGTNTYMMESMLLPISFQTVTRSEGRSGQYTSNRNGMNRKSQENCHQFLAHGTCRFGDKCKFQHPSLNQSNDPKNGQQHPQGTQAPKQMQGALKPMTQK